MPVKDENNMSDDELELVRHSADGGVKVPRSAKAALQNPTNFYGFALAVGNKWGFAALVAVAVMTGFWQVLKWQREDQKVFVGAVQANTKAIEALATEQRTMNTTLVKHLEHDERRPH